MMPSLMSTSSPAAAGGDDKSKSGLGDLNAAFWIYLIVNQALGSAVLDGGINAFLAWLTYKDASDTGLWVWPSTLAGDIILTALLEPFLTWVIGGALASADIRKRKWFCNSELPNTPYPRFLKGLRWILTPEAFNFSKGDRWWTFFFKLFFCIRGGLLFSVPYIFIVGGGVSGITTAIVGADYRFTMAQCIVYKAVYGAVFALFVTPVVAWLALAQPAPSKYTVGERTGPEIAIGGDPETGVSLPYVTDGPDETSLKTFKV
eukprot:TRINITY_DN19066_c0_g1_i1.p1 TRINITY_DN19066_c0_g1~~TRINITY_DN19066_c0_g1_i1.p1  ORF type:complete len:261 (+),score=29.25 TRINITY_DN19066_c0_g1_i1:61-843(+)